LIAKRQAIAPPSAMDVRMANPLSLTACRFAI
jgi:hypothetical protein